MCDSAGVHLFKKREKSFSCVDPEDAVFVPLEVLKTIQSPRVIKRVRPDNTFAKVLLF